MFPLRLVTAAVPSHVHDLSFHTFLDGNLPGCPEVCADLESPVGTKIPFQYDSDVLM
jgi:hypothetical protein